MMDIRGLAYVVASSRDLGAWRRQAEEVLGMMVEEGPLGDLYIKMDERPFRLFVSGGPADRYVASGWELAGEEAFEQACAELERAGVPFERGCAELCAVRRVNGLASLRDPSGNLHELVWGVCSDFRRFVSSVGVPGFVTGELGMGHTVLPAENFAETWAFLRDVMGFGLSDIHRFQPAQDAPAIPIYFLHCNNGRHHSLALFGAPVPSGCVHLMVEVENLVEVGRAHDRMQRAGVKLMATLGQHVNDRMTSFYMDTPSGFAIEYGFGGLVLDWTRHSVYEATEVSVWGHDFGVGFNAPSH